MNFLINFCQSLNIPFFTEDSDLNIKKCGLRKPEYIKKLSILKELVGNHYVNIMLSFFFLFFILSYFNYILFNMDIIIIIIIILKIIKYK